MRLTAGEPVAVRFGGGRAVERPMTLGQLNILRWLDGAADHPYSSVDWRLDLPAGATVDDVAATLAVLIAEHEGLRTTYLPGDPPVQRVAAAGELVLEVYSVDPVHIGAEASLAAPVGRAGVDQAAVEAELTRLLRARPHDPARQWPLRVAVAARSGALCAGVATCSHLAVDFQAATYLADRFAALVRDPARRPGGPRHQPADQADAERRPLLRQRADAALTYWERTVATIPRCVCAWPRTSTPGGSAAAHLSSVAAAGALRHIAARTRISPSTVVLAAVCAVLAHQTGYERLGFAIMAGNRSDRELVDYVGTLAQAALVAVDVGPCGFDELVRRTFSATLNANRHGRYDVYRQVPIVHQVELDRGVRFDFEPLYNNVAATPPANGRLRPIEEVYAARTRSTLRWEEPMPPLPSCLRVDVVRLVGALRLRLWRGDTSPVSRPDLESLLLAVDRLLVAAAPGDVDAARIAAAIALEPVERGPNWLLVDSCWVELTEVQRLLDDALGPATARVFAAADDRALVAYLAGTGPVCTPAEAHARCMSALPGRCTAMAPRHYVVCDRAPDDPADLAGWQRRPVLAAGSGRAAPAAG